MRILYAILLILSFYGKTFSQKRNGKIEQLFPLVAYIETNKVRTHKIDQVDWEVYLRNPKTNELRPDLVKFIGTGFFVAKDIDLYFITAEHVASSTDINTSVSVSIDDQNSRSIKFNKFVDPNYIVNGKINWIVHPDADVALVPVSTDVTGILGLPYEIVFNKLEAPMRETNLIVYGFPLGLGTGTRLSPISKRYNTSSGLLDLPRFDNRRPSVFFLIDDPSISGLSGGPVLALPQKLEYFDGTTTMIKDHQLLGLVHGTITKDGGGYGAIVPAKFIKEVIDLAPSYNGKYTFKYEDGKIWSEVIYKDGFPWEVLSNYNRNGVLQEKGTLKNGNGTLFIYDKEGKLMYIFHHKNGLITTYEVIK